MLVGLPWLGKGFIPGRSGIAQATAGFALVSALAGICLIIQKLLSRRACPPFLTARPVLWLSLQVTVVMVFAVTASVYLRQAASLEIPLRQDAPEMPEGPNLILVTMDTVRADHTSAYGYYRETTPTLEGLAAESTLYLNAIAPGDMTLSTHASIFTGLPVNWHGAHYSYQNPGGQPLAEGFNTLAEMLARNGYFTAGVVANHGYLGHWFQLDQGFDYYDERAPISFFPETPMGVLREALRRVLTIWFHPSFLTTIYRTAEEIHTETLKLIEELHKRNRPWFLFLNYMDAHTPYQPPPPFDTRFPGKNRLFTWPRYLEIKKKLLRQEYKLTLKEKQHLVSQYDGGIAYQDHYLGMLLDELIKRGLYEDSLIIVTSDHGEAFGERSL
ncbi:MAG: sulfatase-like hydrolase/transferase, partial [Gammaproteobacteria bacterium]|nr:sulfatase-like hydrolase/transferase [Gammaproteobacteria bacterium]